MPPPTCQGLAAALQKDVHHPQQPVLVIWLPPQPGSAVSIAQSRHRRCGCLPALLWQQLAARRRFGFDVRLRYKKMISEVHRRKGSKATRFMDALQCDVAGRAAKRKCRPHALHIPHHPPCCFCCSQLPQQVGSQADCLSVPCLPGCLNVIPLPSCQPHSAPLPPPQPLPA